MSPLPPHQDRVERRDRALALRRKIKAIAGAGGVAAVGLVGYFVAVGAPAKTAIPAVSAVRTVTTVITVGDDGVTSKTTTTTLSPGESRVSSTILTCRRHARSGLLDNYPPVTVTALAAVPAASSPTVMTVGARMSASDAMS